MSSAQLLSPPDVSHHLGISEKTLGQWRWRRLGPKFIRVGRHVRYRPEDVEAWLTSQTIGGES